MAKTKKAKKKSEDTLSNDFALKTMSVSEFFKTNKLMFHTEQDAKVREEKGLGVRYNTNDYPFLTTKVKGSPKGEGGMNIYFTNDASALVEEFDTLPMFSKEMQMVEVELSSQPGTFVWKFCPKGESSYDDSYDYDSL